MVDFSFGSFGASSGVGFFEFFFALGTGIFFFALGTGIKIYTFRDVMQSDYTASLCVDNFKHVSQ